ncbi:unconventional myosin-XVIIIa-like isoform X2 [Cherax quadricarinatus]
MKEKRSSVEVRQRIAQWEGWGHTKEAIVSSSEHEASPEPHLTHDSDGSSHTMCVEDEITATHCLASQQQQQQQLSLHNHVGEDQHDSALLHHHHQREHQQEPELSNTSVRKFWQQQTLKLELELKEEKISALSRELEDLSFTGKTEEEVAVLKKAKHDLELRLKDQEEELDDLAGQVQMLEGAKVRLEMSIEQMRKENRREISQREEELEEVRISAQKKIKALESQLENEHEERTVVVREKHELERRINELQDRTITHVDEDYVHKLKKELKKTKALLRDTQTMLEKSQSEGGHKLLVRQLKTQLEDAEFAKTAAIKARQCAEADIQELSSQLEEAQRARKESEDRCARVAKDRAEIQTQLEESEEEVAEVMKKYKSCVSQLSVDQITLSEQSQQIAELEHEKQVLQERMLELSSKVEVLEGETANIHTQRRLEMKIKEIESKLELEQTTRQRLESQIGRLKDQIERLTGDCDAARQKETQALEQSKKISRQLREAKEDLSALQQKHTDAVNKKGELEKQLELADSEVITLKSDLKLAFKRIEDLQQAIQGDINDSDSDISDRMEQPNSPCSEAMSAISEDLDDVSNKESYA